MTFVQLKYALALHKFGTFKLAAERLGITQPGLSLQIQKLEEKLGITLFDRSSSPVTLTQEGREFLTKAEEIVVSFNHLQEFSTTLNEGFNGLLTIGIIPTLAPFIVPLFVDDLQTNYTEFKLDIHEMTTEEVVNGVRNGELDAGLISTPAELSGINTKPLFYERFFLYGSEAKDDRVAVELKNLNYKKLWLLNEGNCFRDQVNNLCDLKKIRKDKDFIYRSNSIDALIRIVDTKGGITILPELTTLSLNAHQEENFQAIGKKAREISLITRKHHNKDRFIKILCEFIVKNVPVHMRTDELLELVDPQIRM